VADLIDGKATEISMWGNDMWGSDGTIPLPDIVLDDVNISDR
jgi:hypothetical protein